MRKFNKLIDRVGLIIVKILLVYQLKLIVVAGKTVWFLILEYISRILLGFEF